MDHDSTRVQRIVGLALTRLRYAGGMDREHTILATLKKQRRGQKTGPEFMF